MKNFSGIEYENKVYEQVNLFDLEFEDCVFKNCKFNECNIINCIFTDCKFIGCTFVELGTKNVNVLFAEFDSCTIVGVKWHEFQKGSISFPIGKLKDCYLKYNQFDRLNFKKFNFNNSSIVDSTFARCDLSESSFKNCDLKITDFIECNISKADFRGAKGYNIDIMKINTKGAKFSYPEVVILLIYFNIVLEK